MFASFGRNFLLGSRHAVEAFARVKDVLFRRLTQQSVLTAEAPESLLTDLATVFSAANEEASAVVRELEALERSARPALQEHNLGLEAGSAADNSQAGALDCVKTVGRHSKDEAALQGEMEATMTCKECGGRGSVKCPQCRGTGRSSGTECKLCAGSGVKKCGVCMGKGTI